MLFRSPSAVQLPNTDATDQRASPVIASTDGCPMSRLSAVIDCAGRALDLTQARIMGVLNVTPDSFSDGGAWAGQDAAVRWAVEMARAGADLIDVGGESTRPGSAPVSVCEEIHRTVPVIERLVSELDCPISIDTSKPEVMRAAVEAGAGMINDVCALRQPGALMMAAELAVPVCLMHMLGEPGTMQDDPSYEHVVDEVESFLLERVGACVAGGIPREKILIDPGFGFGKRYHHNLELMRALPRLAAHGHPLLVGVSRKSMLGEITGKDVGHRAVASAAAAIIAVQSGAAIVRVHDVSETADALKVLRAVWPCDSMER